MHIYFTIRRKTQANRCDWFCHEGKPFQQKINLCTYFGWPTLNMTSNERDEPWWTREIGPIQSLYEAYGARKWKIESSLCLIVSKFSTEKTQNWQSILKVECSIMVIWKIQRYKRNFKRIFESDRVKFEVWI